MATGGKPRALVAAALLLCACTNGGSLPGESAGGESPATVVFLAEGARTSLTAEPAAAWEWLSGRPDLDARFLQLVDLEVEPLPPRAILWFHHAGGPDLPSAAMRPEALRTVRDHLQAGGRLLLSLLAVPWAVPLGLESTPPNRIAMVPGTDFVRWDEEDDRVLAGFESYRGHPLLRRFWGGTYTATPRPGRDYPVARYEGDAWPREGRVVAVSKRYIGVDPERRTLIEYPPANGGSDGLVVAVGEGLWFADRGNRNRIHLLRFADDLLTYLDGGLPPVPPGASIPSTGAHTVVSERTAGADGPDTALPELLATTSYWSPRSRTVERWDPASEAEPAPATDQAVLQAVTASRSGLVLEAPAESDTPFDLYGPRSLVVGRQSGELDDLWTYPYRALRHLRFRLIGDDGAVYRLDDPEASRTFVARPEGSTLRVAWQTVEVDLHLAIERERGGMVAILRIATPEPLLVVADWEADHSIMWPREASHLGALEIGWDPTAKAVAWRDPAGRFHGLAGFGREPVAFRIGYSATELAADLTRRPASVPSATEPIPPPNHLSADPEPAGARDPEPEIPLSPPAEPPPLTSARAAVAVRFDPATDVALPFVVSAGPTEAPIVGERYRSALADPAAVWSANANYWRQFLGETLDLATPDPTFDEAFRWAKVGLEAFRVRTPGLGTGLTAGYAASKDPAVDAWHADNDFLRRPGYGWYFGRDAIWTAFAADAYGGTDLTSEALRLLARYQDVDGKIFHEMSPAGALHYDAADSTPLFLLGLEHHVRTTGDRELLRTLWPAVRRAMTYLETTDTDGDGLIENTGVGHGWIEGGRFYGAHTTFYLASLWAATLEAVERMASWMTDEELLGTVAGRGEEVAAIIESEFWDPEGRTYHYGKRRDGTFMPIRTILPAVGMALDVLDPTRVRPLLEMFAGAGISSDWGARMVERTNPDYNPEGYHDGSVWPLYSGWTSLAAYRHHRPLQAFSHLYGNLRLYRSGSLGTVPEVLHGERFEPIGVTQHQAWSQAMALLPAIEGMLGIRTDAIAGELRLHPHLPAGWDRVVVQRIELGASRFDIGVVREEESTRFEIERAAGSDPVRIELSLPLPRAVLVNLDRDETRGVVLVDPETIVDRPEEKEARVVVSPIEPTASVVFRHGPYPRLAPPVHTPDPGAPSRGLRVLDTVYRNGQLQVRLEALPGRPYELALTTPWPVAAVSGVPEARITSPGPGRATVEISLPGESETYRRAEIRIEFRR